MSKVLVQFIQDRSGSMGTVWDETLSGFKSFVSDLKEKGKSDGVEYLFSLTTFDTLIENPISGKPISEVDENGLNKHGPRGSTALYDAVGHAVKSTEDNPEGADKIVVVIVTDGHENSSREWSKDALHAAIDSKLKLGNWTFTYLGTQPETWDDAQSLGIGQGATATYTPNMANDAYTATAGAVHRLATSASRGTTTLMSSHLPSAVARASGMKTKNFPGINHLKATIPTRKWRS